MGSPGSDADWVRDESLNAFADKNLRAVEAALGGPHAVVFGWHYHYASGSSRDGVTFVDFPTFLAFIERARPGDHVTLYDLDRLRSSARSVVGDPAASSHRDIGDAVWAPLAQRIVDSGDTALVRRFVGPLTKCTQAELIEFEDAEADHRVALQRERVHGHGQLTAFDFQLFDQSEHGSVDSVTPKRGERRIHAIVDAKRPNVDGRVPLSGPY